MNSDKDDRSHDTGLSIWIKFQIKIKINLFMLQSTTINKSVVLKFLFNIECKGDPQMALLKAASMRNIDMSE